MIHCHKREDVRLIRLCHQMMAGSLPVSVHDQVDEALHLVDVA